MNSLAKTRENSCLGSIRDVQHSACRPARAVAASPICLSGDWVTHSSLLLKRFIAYLGVPETPHRTLHELDRAFQRAVGSLAVSLIWILKLWLQPTELEGESYGLPMTLTYLAISVLYIRRLRRNPDSGTTAQFVFLVLDPIILVLVLILDPAVFAFAYPFLLIVIIRSGLRYGVRIMYLSWGVALVATAFLPMTDFWRGQAEFTLSLVLLLAMVPGFFSSLIKRIHNARAIEEDRARLLATNDAVIARSAFLAKVSHELRSPLQNIISALDLFEFKHRASQGDSELIGAMRRSSLLLNTQLRDLLTLAKGEAGRLDIRPETFEACTLVDSIADGAQELARAKDLKLTVELPADAIFVIADSARIDQILTNLVINSIRYTSRGQVRISLHPYDPSVRRLRLTVADTGPGIPEDLLPHLFAPDKISTGTERRGEGSGIGLAIVRTLLTLLGGEIVVSSRIGQGTTFTLDIPAEPIPAEDATGVEGRSGRVLIVDDQEELLASLAGVVDELGYECDRASSPAVASNLLASRRYAFIFLDLQMPVKDGSELAADIRRSAGPNQDARLIAMSAAESLGELADDFDEFLIKPIDYASLRRTLLGAEHAARPSQPGLWAED